MKNFRLYYAKRSIDIDNSYDWDIAEFLIESKIA